jgi:hypothetical protein
LVSFTSKWAQIGHYWLALIQRMEDGEAGSFNL